MTVRPDTVLAARGDDKGFRFAVRSYLASVIPDGWQEKYAGADQRTLVSFQRGLLDKLASAGLAVPHWPEQWGGVGFTLSERIIICEELARAEAPNLGIFGVSFIHVPATMHAWGTAEQRTTYIPGVLQGDIWCQGFSEPNAGSDLANIRTRALRDGDDFIVNGQKIWTSGGMVARYCLLVARTDPSLARSRGLSCFVMDMASPGITTRPIVQANGEADFAEMFLDNVKIPAANLIGPEGAGWEVLQSTLSAERGMFIFELSERMLRFLSRIAGPGSENAPWRRDDELRRAIAAAYVKARAISLMVRRMVHLLDGDEPIAGLAEPMLVKLAYSSLYQHVGELLVRMQGIDALRHNPGYIQNGYPTDNAMFDYITSFMWTISGGTNEIMRNIIAERVLRMPKS